MKKKIILLLIMLPVIAMAAALTYTSTYSAKDKLLMENVAALAGEWISADWKVELRGDGNENIPKWDVSDRPDGGFNCSATGHKCCYKDGKCPSLLPFF
jgi:hypothetical protein